MILTAKKGTAFEQTLKELYDQHIRNKKEAIEVLTDYFGVKPLEMTTSWGYGRTGMILGIEMKPVFVPRTLRKGVKEYIGGLTVDRRTKVGREFLAHWDTLACAKGLSGKSLEPFGIYTLDPDTREYGFWRVYMTDDDLYCLAIGEYAARRLSDEAREMMTIDIQH